MHITQAEKQAARKKVYKAVLKGILIKPKFCSVCGKDKNLEGHHEDYNKPLVVEWLCRDCHRNIHVTNGSLRRESVNLTIEEIFERAVMIVKSPSLPCWGEKKSPLTPVTVFSRGLQGRAGGLS